MTAGHAETGERLAQHFRAYPCEEPFAAGVGQGSTQQGRSGERGLAPLAQGQEQQGQHCAEDEHGAELADLGDHDHDLVQSWVPVLLYQGDQALVELRQVRIADEQPCQNQQAQAGHQQGCPAMAPQAAVDAQADKHHQAANDDARLGPEAFGQGQANRRASGPARQQIGQRPARRRQQADGEEAWERHVEHSGHHRQHRS